MNLETGLSETKKKYIHTHNEKALLRNDDVCRVMLNNFYATLIKEEMRSLRKQAWGTSTRAVSHIKLAYDEENC